jgi:hypothetical protein
MAMTRRAALRIVDGPGMDALRLTRKWDGPLGRSRLVNTGRAPVRIKEVVLFDVAHALPPETKLPAAVPSVLPARSGRLLACTPVQ